MYRGERGRSVVEGTGKKGSWSKLTKISLNTKNIQVSTKNYILKKQIWVSKQNQVTGLTGVKGRAYIYLANVLLPKAYNSTFLYEIACQGTYLENVLLV